VDLIEVQHLDDQWQTARQLEYVRVKALKLSS
jgi:hypothetical protein